MPVSKLVLDFTEVSRRAFETALRVPHLQVRASAPPPSTTRDNAERQSHALLISSLARGEPLRVASRRAGLRRDQAKQVLERESVRWARTHATLLTTLRVPDLVCASARTFTSKQRTGRPSKVTDEDVNSVWTHLWHDVTTGVVALWMLGPKSLPEVAARNGLLAVWQMFLAMSEPDSRQNIDSASSALGPATRVLSEGADAGLGKKTREHWLATGLFAAAHNFCSLTAGGATPAMRAGWSTEPWATRDLVGRSPEAPESS